MLEIQNDQRVARWQGAGLSLGARAFDVLSYLHAHADRVVSKAELLDHVWQGLIVEDGNLAVQITALCKALGRTAIKTVPGVGYRLTIGAAPVEVEGPAVPDIPSLAVLPFSNLTGSVDREYLVDGIVTEIIGALGRVGSFFVTSSTSTFTYKGRAVDLAEVGRELGVRYILEGSIQAAGERIRIFTQLVEAETGRMIWQDRFDGEMGDIFDLQDQVAESVAGALEPKLIWAEAARARAKPTESLSAYDLCLKATPMVARLDSAEGLEEGVKLLRKALELDPAYNHAKALICFACVTGVATRFWSFEKGAMALDYAEEVVNSSEDDPVALAYAGNYLGYVHRRYRDSLIALERAERINPNSATTAMLKGWLHVYRDENDEAVACLTRAKRLSPLHPNLGVMTCGFGNVALQRGQPEEAIVHFEQALSEYPTFMSTVQGLMTAYHAVGRMEEAAELARQYRERAPEFSVESFLTHRAVASQGYVDLTVRAMRDLGFPETGVGD
ncbi:winged helix-turn-helix domain-containing protein [Hasllibacter sp. MH4015]|uniref:winged helix-turn-helix domain-containing protein n=1 Tax=Hasllibacter sp. MH4015 TaxID=2854029 RepID=UPI001CD28CD6|nr:winged helix-turn-helix domain-containing protein [Hasllibacter sp. MH4015]